MNIDKLKIGGKLWSTRHNEGGEIASINKNGWSRLRISGKLRRGPVEELRRRKPAKRKPKKEFVLFEELHIEDQRKVLKASNYCDLPIQTVMEELELT